MTGGPRRPSAVGAVLRDALDILRRNALAFAALGGALGVLPTIAASQAVPLLLPEGAEAGAIDGPLMARSVAALACPALAYLSATALDVAVVAIALGGARGTRAIVRLVMRLLPVDLFSWVAAEVVMGVAPAPLRGVVAAAFVSWSIMLPAFVAESVRLRDLPRRSLALARRRPAAVIALFACAFAVDAAVASDAFGFEPDYPLGPPEEWTAAFAWSSVVFDLQITADAIFAALYLALRRHEGNARDEALASAFE